MKRNLKLKLFGPPKVYVNQKDIRFSFSKMEALLYYLAVMGEVNRDEIAGILWGDKENQVARKNLRNTVYQANKIFEGDVIVSPSRSSLALNPDLDLHLDVQLFERDPIRHLNLYQGDFLEGFYVKDDEDFDGRIFFPGEGSKSLFKDALFQSCEKELLDKKYSSSNLDWSRTPIYFRSNYVVVGANPSNLYVNKLSANHAAVRQSFFSGCTKPREALKYVKTFIEDSPYFLSSNGFLALAQWVESTNGTDRPYYLDDYVSNVGYLSMEVYEELVRLAKHIARGMLVTLDWVEESLVEQPSLESLCLGV